MLEGLGSLATSPEEVEKLLGDCSDFLKGCLDSFKPPSSASKAAVESGTVSSYGDQPLNLNESIRKVTVEASTRLALDEVQTYALLRRCLDEDKFSAVTHRLRRRPRGPPHPLLLRRATPADEMHPGTSGARHRRRTRRRRRRGHARALPTRVPFGDLLAGGLEEESDWRALLAHARVHPYDRLSTRRTGDATPSSPRCGRRRRSRRRR